MSTLLKKSEIENQLQKVKFEKIDVENNLRAKIDSLESQILSLEDAKEHEKTNSDFKIVSTNSEFILNSLKHIMNLTDIINLL